MRTNYYLHLRSADSINGFTFDGEAFHSECINIEIDGPWDGETLPEGFAPLFFIDVHDFTCDTCGEKI
jgi:hypothetical protein